jgi:HK97 family phage prohead protease
MELATRAYAAFEVKALGDGRRTFKGWATTPAIDRVGDTINPLGVRFKNPVALCHQHRHDSPIGTAIFGTPTKRGIEFDAEIPEVDEQYASLRDRCDTAWGELKYGLVRAVSVGFRAIKYAFKDDGGVDYQEIEVFELSTVTIPALPQAVITAVKSMSPLSSDFVREIKRFDRDWSTFGVPLLQVSKSADAPLPLGAVRLVASS